MLRAPLMLYMTAVPFEYPRSDWPPSVRMVGPGVWDPPARPPSWLEEISRPLRTAVREAMTKKAGAERIASAFAAARNPEAAVDALEELPGRR